MFRSAVSVMAVILWFIAGPVQAPTREKFRPVTGRIVSLEVDQTRCHWEQADQEDVPMVRCPATLTVATRMGGQYVHFFYAPRNDWYHVGDSLACEIDQHGWLGHVQFVGHDSIDNRKMITF